MNTRTFSFKLTAFIVASLVIAAIIAGGLWTVLRKVEADSEARTARVVAAKNVTYRVLESVVGVQAGLQETLRLKDPDEIEKSLERYKKDVSALQALIGSTKDLPPATTARYKELSDTYQQVIDKFLLGDVSAAYELMISVAPQNFSALLQTVRDYSASTEAAMRAEAKTAAAITSRLINTTLGLSGVLVVVLVGYGWRFRHTTSRQLRRIADSVNEASSQVAAAAGQVSMASQSLAQGSTEQAASIEETSASLEEMSGMTKRNSENADNANHLASQARQAADTGSTDVQAMNAAMADIKGSSDDIAKIIKTIDEIAFQTNILALNAAVEAARAGEAGLGFAVVADEVRTLAQRSAEAARETAAKIESAIAKTAQGVQISGKVAANLAQIVEKVRRVDALVAEVATASREQSQGVAQINTAVGQMDKVVQTNAAAAEESASAAQELNAQAAMLVTFVGELRDLVGHDEAPAGHEPTRTAAPASPATELKRPPKTAAKPLVEHHGFFNHVPENGRADSLHFGDIPPGRL